jgi:hypothetical protein
MKKHDFILMKKRSTSYLVIPLIFLVVQSSFGQVRLDVPDYLSRKFTSYCQSVPREEVFMHTDRDEYIAGEVVWFTVYTFDRQTLSPSLNSRLVYVELVAPDNRPLIKSRFAINMGSGPGQFQLPDTLSSGLYTIRAYTGWMKNFLPDNCFTKDIRIYNAISSKPFKGALRKNTIVRRDTVISRSGKVSVKIDNLNPDSLEIGIDADSEFRNSGNETIYLFIETRGNINLVRSEKLNGERTRISIPRSILMPGINHITLFDKDIRPVCERFIYSAGREEKQQLSVIVEDNYNTRSKISLGIASEENISLSEANMSISVSPLTGSAASNNISDYLLFGSEFGELPGDFLNGKKVEDLSEPASDSLLNCLESNWIRWNAILASDIPKLRFNHESEDHYLSGKLINSDQHPAPSGETVILSIPGKVALFQYALTDNDGNFSFPLPVDEEKRELVIQPGNNSGKYRIIVETSFADLVPGKEIDFGSSSSPAPLYISEWSSNFQVARIYGTSPAEGFLKPLYSPQLIRRFYGKPELEIRLDDYISLPLMEEVFFELLPRVILKSNKSQYELYLVDPLRNRLYDEPPAMMINGVIFTDPAIIGNMDPALVEKIDAIREKYIVGDYQFPGIVNVITRSTDYHNMAIPSNAIRIPYEVAEPAASFNAPAYMTESLKKSRIPDFRNTLYWNPAIRPGKDGRCLIEFWSSDIASDYIIRIEGVSAEGKIVSLKKTISVK